MAHRMLPVLMFPFLLRECLSPFVPFALQLLYPSILLFFFLCQSLFKLCSLFLVLLQSLLMLRFALNLAALKIVHAIVEYLFSALQILLKVLVESAKFVCFVFVTIQLASRNVASRACGCSGRIHSWRNRRRLRRTSFRRKYFVSNRALALRHATAIQLATCRSWQPMTGRRGPRWPLRLNMTRS